MANHSYGVSLPQHSQTSDNIESFQRNSQNFMATQFKSTSHHLLGDTASPFVAHNNQSSLCPDQCNTVSGGGGKSNVQGSGSYSANRHKKLLKQAQKPKGRPPGSKNKPKAPIIISKMDEEALKPVIIEISAGCDVVNELIKFAQSRDSGLTVLNGSGSVTNVTLSHTFSNAPSLTLHGTFTMLSLSGTFVKSHVASPFASSSTLPNPSLLFPGYSSFTICLAGAQGQIFGGVIAGRIIAASLVVVVATTFKKPMLHRCFSSEPFASVLQLGEFGFGFLTYFEN
ncbi:AT-hook motif nuclear-localized protein 28-like [Prosopis cineraria]|uniref:AT-hook motif nuclear-localized protein 28-like n=1 Tax=Prosopis cineraria TaxID=364024 RepID=UPI00240ED502|nr:AT-hook motif nuclear-localized protein 28-like [Prosopis cineraria]